MPTRFRPFVRSHPGRAAGAVVAGLLACGAVVAAVGGGGSGPAGTESSLSSKASAPAEGPGEAERNAAAPVAGSTGAVATTAPALPGAALASPQASSSGAASDAVAGRTAQAAAPGAPVPPGVGPSPGGLGGQPVPAAVAAGTSRVIKNAILEVSVRKGGLGDSYQRAVDAAAAVGGWVQASQTGGDQATLTLKVPSDRLEGVVGAIRGLGKVTSVSESGEDVTAEFVDLEARIGHWRAQEAVFVGLMAKARTIPETIQIQQQLSTIQEQIEQLEGRRKYLDGQTSFSTVKLTLLEEGAVAKPEPGPKPASTLAGAWRRSAGAALAVLGGTIVVLGVLVPLAAVVGIPAWVLAAVLRRRDGRRQEGAAPAQV
jgi:hypothetical protein